MTYRQLINDLEQLNIEKEAIILLITEKLNIKKYDLILSLDKEIDSIILSSKGDEDDEDDQVLDIDAMFIETSNEQPESIIETKPTAEPTKSKKLSIDSIFNVESDSDTDEDGDNLANDFEQYINNLENKES